MSFERARQPEQKQQRLDSILSAAGALFDQHGINEVSMREIAQLAGLGKASLYHYFQTKEEVFLELFLLDLEAWVTEFEKQVGRLRKPNSERIATIVSRLMVEHSRCSRLMSLLSSVLERNIATEQLRDFKTRILTPMGRIAVVIGTALPHLSETKIHEFLLQFQVIVGGLWPLAHPTDDLKAAIDVPHLRLFQVDFESQCKKLVLMLLDS